ncbi:MAG: hypothetical protein ABSG95_15085, partial [Solirubrobacteraceae bacterium]
MDREPRAEGTRPESLTAAFVAERASGERGPTLPLWTTDEKQGVGVLFRSHFATISSIGSVADSPRRAADRLLR